MIKYNAYYNLSKEGTRIAKELAGYVPNKSGRNSSENDEVFEGTYPQYFKRWQDAAKFALAHALANDLKPGDEADSTNGITFETKLFDKMNDEPVIPMLIEVYHPDYDQDPYKLAIQYIDSGLKDLKKKLGDKDSQKSRLYEIIKFENSLED
jgi:hypothetical protein